jgi:hypothetical protein
MNDGLRSQLVALAAAALGVVMAGCGGGAAEAPAAGPPPAAEGAGGQASCGAGCCGAQCCGTPEGRARRQAREQGTAEGEPPAPTSDPAPVPE